MANFPSFYDPSRIGTLYHPNVAAIAAEAAAASLSPAADDELHVHFVIIDMQIDFCHVNGTLSVPGAIGDLQRTIEYIYTHAERISTITCSLDSHLPHQIFSPDWWADGDGNPPAPFTLITLADIEAGTWQPTRDVEQSIAYVRQLEQEAKKVLTIWPYHTMIGNIGQALDQELWSAVFWHSLARQTQPRFLTKGSIPQTEHYSIIQPEVMMPSEQMGVTNQAFLDELAQADLILVAGEAESHCVLESVEDMIEGFKASPETISKIRLYQDMTSPVVHPEIDFHAMALEKFKAFEAAGIVLTDSRSDF
ncbi:MAG: hypothetical protein AAF633_13075 [Chloroflexota bacterium]